MCSNRILSAFLNTLFFMAALVGLFGNTDYGKNLMGGHNIIIGCCLMVGIKQYAK